MALAVSARKRQAGYTVIEMLIVLALVITGTVVAIPVTMQMVQNAKGDTALTMASTFIQGARSRAVAERRNIILNFVSATKVQYERIEVPSGTRTVLESMTLEGDNQFVKLGALPDTPDAFGGAAAVNFTGGQPVMFTSDGSFVDAAGDVSNATIFVANPVHPETARAITIAGVTGFIRSWKWRGAAMDALNRVPAAGRFRTSAASRSLKYSPRC